MGRRLNWWAKGHRSNLKLQYSYTKAPAKTFEEGESAVLLQARALFKWAHRRIGRLVGRESAVLDGFEGRHLPSNEHLRGLA